jgi:stage III sporulation protein AD
MNIFTYCAVALLCVCAVSILKSVKSEITPYAIAGAGLLLLGVAVRELTVISQLEEIIGRYGSKNIFSPLIKALIVSLLCQITAEMCRDFGENGIAQKVEFGGKVVIIGLSVPIIKEVLSSAEQML